MMFRALVTIGAVQLVTMLVLLVRTKALAVMLGPENVGVMAVIDKLLAVIAQTVSLSLPFAAVRFLPERWAAGPAQYREMFVRMRNVLLVLVLAATAAALLVSTFRPATWGEALLPYRDVVIMAALGLPAVAFLPFLQNAVAGRMQQNRSMLVGFLHAVVAAIGVAGAWWAGLQGYYAVFAVGGTVLAVVVARLAIADTARSAPAAPPGERTVIGLPLALWRFSGTLLILAFLMPYAALYAHYKLLSDHGPQAAGWMQAAVGISLAVRATLGSAHAVFLTPNVNRGGSPRERMEWANHFQATFCVLAGVSVPLLLLFPGLAVFLLYSPDFMPGAPFVALFVLVEVLLLLSGTYQSLVVALDHMRFHFASNLVAQLLVVAAAWQLVGPHGILGVALAVLLAPVFLYASTMIFLYRTHGLAMPGAVAARSGWLLASILAAGAAGALLPEATGESLLAKLFVYALAVAGIARLLTPHERRRVREAIEGWKTWWNRNR